MRLKRRPNHPFRAFAAARSAVAAVEFAVIMPLLIIVVLGGAELARYIVICRTLTNLSSSLASMVAARTTPFNFNDAVFDYYSAFVTMPFLLGDAASRGVPWNFDVGMTVSSVVFTPTQAGCTSNCTYNAKVAWSVNSPIAVMRSCAIAPTAVSDSSAPNMTTLPQDVFTAGSVIVADVAYVYTPMFGSRFIQPVVLARSFYMQPRYMSSIPYQTGSNGAVPDYGYVCP